MSDFKGMWVAPVVTGAVAAVLGGVLLAWLKVGSHDVAENKPTIAKPQNELLHAAGPDYSDLAEKVKIQFDGFDRSSLSQFTGIPNLIFSFTNLSPKTAKISGSKGCNLVGWQFSRNGKTVEVTKSAMLNQNGSSIIGVPAQSTKRISYRVDLLDPPAFGSEENASSVCRFWVGFGGSAMLYEVTALADSPQRE